MKDTIQKIYAELSKIENRIKELRSEILDIMEGDGDLSLERPKSASKKDSSNENTFQDADEKGMVYGVFDGEKMIGKDGEEYPVPPNYASKSRLVFGDTLKLFLSNGQPRFKPVELVEREWAIGEIVQRDGQYKIFCDGVLYNVIFASVTYYRLSPGDKVSIILPEGRETAWATIDSKAPQNS